MVGKGNDIKRALAEDFFFPVDLADFIFVEVKTGGEILPLKHLAGIEVGEIRKIKMGDAVVKTVGAKVRVDDDFLILTGMGIEVFGNLLVAVLEAFAALDGKMVKIEEIKVDKRDQENKGGGVKGEAAGFEIFPGGKKAGGGDQSIRGDGSEIPD